MIRIRHVENKDVIAQELAQAYRFVEICDLDGNVGAVVFMDDKGTIKLIKPTDPDALRYSKMYGVKFSQLKVITPAQLTKTH